MSSWGSQADLADELKKGLSLSHSSVRDESELLEDDVVSLTSSDPGASALLGSTQEEQEMSEGEEAEAEPSQTSCPAYEELLEVMDRATETWIHYLATTTEDLLRYLVPLPVETLSNEALKPCKLRRHLETKHRSFASKPREFFENKLKDYQQRKKVIESTYVMGGKNEKAVTASYEVSRLIATSGKPHTIGEDLILPAAKQMVSIMLGNNAVKQLNLISLSNNTVKRRIDDMSENVFQQLICRVRASRFYAIQIEESTDIAGMANLLAFIRYECDGDIEENLLFCRPLHSNTTAEAIFDILNDFMISNNINWTKCVGLSIDGARAMLGRHSGVVKRVRDVAPLLTHVHCCIRREALATKRMPVDLKTVLDDAEW
ncbi:hypothetical protein QQF64_034045 [Cirrhinus molitorella]|uniref:DUF4371 domain-containing protein n=1 Tax=Cirrhinus molitorella TaxID=172907 RepID=A0ABR3MVM5_9TELE